VQRHAGAVVFVSSGIQVVLVSMLLCVIRDAKLKYTTVSQNPLVYFKLQQKATVMPASPPLYPSSVSRAPSTHASLTSVDDDTLALWPSDEPLPPTVATAANADALGVLSTSGRWKQPYRFLPHSGSFS
jgi:hypothetical protein